VTNIYVKQSALRISARTGTTLSDISVCEIRYEMPDGRRGSWSAFVSDPVRGIISYDLLGDELILHGWWKFWVFVTFIDGRSAYGNAVKLFVNEEGT
jgi:hypothetical protein